MVWMRGNRIKNKLASIILSIVVPIYSIVYVIAIILMVVVGILALILVIPVSVIVKFLSKNRITYKDKSKKKECNECDDKKPAKSDSQFVDLGSANDSISSIINSLKNIGDNNGKRSSSSKR